MGPGTQKPKMKKEHKLEKKSKYPTLKPSRGQANWQSAAGIR